MFKKLLSLFVVAGLFSSLGFAQGVKVAVVDFNRAMSETAEGKAAEKRLKAMADGKKAELTQMDASLRSLAEEYQTKQATLSAEARKSYETRLYEGQMKLQQAVAQNEQAMQEQYVKVMDSVVKTLKKHAAAVGKAEGVTVILEASGVVYHLESIDLTDKVIAKANGK